MLSFNSFINSSLNVSGNTILIYIPCSGYFSFITTTFDSVCSGCDPHVIVSSFLTMSIDVGAANGFLCTIPYPFGVLNLIKPWTVDSMVSKFFIALLLNIML